MMDLGEELGIQSFSFRHFEKNEEVIECLKRCGASTVELCGRHADFTDPEGFGSVAELYAKHDIRIVSIGVQRFDDDREAERQFFECAKVGGFQTISADFRIGSFPANVATAESLAEEYDMRLAIHNHGGRHWLGSAVALQHVFSISGPRVGLCLDTAWAMDSGLDPLKTIEDFGERLHGIHIKDFTFNADRSVNEHVVGSGNLDLTAMVSALKSVDFNGFAVIEYEEDEENPVPAIAKCVAAVREAAAGQIG